MVELRWSGSVPSFRFFADWRATIRTGHDFNERPQLSSNWTEKEYMERLNFSCSCGTS